MTDADPDLATVREWVREDQSEAYLIRGNKNGAVRVPESYIPDSE